MKLFLLLLLLALPAFAQPRTQPQPGDRWCWFGGNFQAGWCNNGWTLTQTQPNANPEPGDVWTYFGPTLGAGWGPPGSAPPPTGSNLLLVGGGNLSLLGGGILTCVTTC